MSGLSSKDGVYLEARAVQALQTLRFASENGGHATLPCIWFPFPNLKEIIRELQTENFPFLDRDMTTIGDGWVSLLPLGFQWRDDCKFYLEALRCIAASTSEVRECPQNVRKIYKIFQQKFSSDADLTLLRNTLTSNKLIHLNGSWLTLKECFWTEQPSAPFGKFSIADVYPDLKDFFDKLGIQSRVCSYIDQLKTLAQGPPSRNYRAISKVIQSLSSGLTAETSLEELKSLKFLPIWQTAGKVTYANISEYFVIADKPEHMNFLGRLPVLALSPEDVSKASKLLKALKLDARFLSAYVLIAEQAKEPLEPPIGTSCELFRQKAFALYSCAFHYRRVKQPHWKDEKLLLRLRNARVQLTESLPISKTYIFIYQEDERLVITVPLDVRERTLCCLWEFPRALCSVLGIVPYDEASEMLVGVVGDILNCRNIDLVDNILEDSNIKIIQTLGEVQASSKSTTEDLSADSSTNDNGKNSVTSDIDQATAGIDSITIDKTTPVPNSVTQCLGGTSNLPKIVDNPAGLTGPTAPSTPKSQPSGASHPGSVGSPHTLSQSPKVRIDGQEGQGASFLPLSPPASLSPDIRKGYTLSTFDFSLSPTPKP